MKSHYNILKVSKQASEEEIRQAFRKLAKRYHPDNNSYDSTKEFVNVLNAYEILSDSGKRNEYDRGLERLTGISIRNYNNNYTSSERSTAYQHKVSASNGLKGYYVLGIIVLYSIFILITASI